jgi:serine/threonine protein phosphatase PrpC
LARYVLGFTGEMPINLTVCGRTDIGLVRKTNEDAFVIADLAGANVIGDGSITRFEIGPRGVLLAVSDGMGGHKAGEVASALVLKSLRHAMTGSPSSRASEAVVESAVQSANRDVWVAAQAPGREEMGATLTALFLEGTIAHIAEVGDSRAYLLRGGDLVQVTRDQSYVQALVESGVMTPEAAEEAPLKNVILQAMGTRPNIKVALGRLDLRQRDCFILCSDGLTNMVTPEEIRATVLSAPRMDVACARLIDLAKQHGGDDNITVILGGVSGDLPPSPLGESIADTFQVLQEFHAPAAP